MYIATLAMNGGQGAIAFAIADYGTKFMIVAGLLNFIAVGGRLPHCHREKTMNQPSAFSRQHSAKTSPPAESHDCSTYTLQRGFVFALFASIVFGITHAKPRET